MSLALAISAMLVACASASPNDPVVLFRLSPGTAADQAHYGPFLSPEALSFEDALAACALPAEPILEGAWLDFLSSGAQVTRLGDHCFYVQLPHAGEHVFRAHARGWGQAVQRLPADVPGRAVFNLKLAPTVRLSGTVVDEDGHPVAGAIITVYERTRYDIRGETDSGGAFHLEVYPGALEVAVTHPEYLPVAKHLSAPESDARLRMRLGGHLGVRPLDGQGRAISAWTVVEPTECGERLDFASFVDARRLALRQRHLTPEQDCWRRQRMGLSRSEALPPGCYAVLVRPQGLAPKVVHASIKGHETQELEVRFERGLSISGQVLDDAGRPVAKASVEAWARLHGQSASTDASGRFTVRGLNRADYALTASHSSSERSAMAKVSAGSRGVTLVVRRWASLRVKVLDAAGRIETRFRMNGMDIATTKSQGELVMHWPAEGRTLLTFEAGGGIAHRAAMFEPGRLVDLGAVNLLPPVDLSLRVTDQRGALATACRSNLGAADLVTVDGPRFPGLLEARGVDPAPRRVAVVCREGYFDGVVDLQRAPEQLPLTQGGRLVVLLPDEVTWAYRPVTVLASERKLPVVEWASQDGVEFQGLPPGQYSLEARQPGWEVLRRSKFTVARPWSIFAPRGTGLGGRR